MMLVIEVSVKSTWGAGMGKRLVCPGGVGTLVKKPESEEKNPVAVVFTTLRRGCFRDSMPDI